MKHFDIDEIIYVIILIYKALYRDVMCRAGTLPEQGSPALASIMAQVHDADDGTKEILGEKGTYAIDASGQTGEVCAYSVTGVLPGLGSREFPFL